MTWYITMYDHQWGRGHTPAESKKVARAQGGKGTTWFTKRLPAGAEDPYVTGMGEIRWTWAEGHYPSDTQPVACPVVACGRSAPAEIKEALVQ